MAYTITNAHIKLWESQVRTLAQQTDTRLRPWVTERVGAAASRSWTRIASLDLVAKGSRGTNTAVSTAIQDSQYSGRVATVATKDGSDLIEQDEIEQVAIDPKAAVKERLAAACNRAIDSIIIAAATGTSADDAGNTVNFDSGQIVGDYNTEFSFKTITDTNAKFWAKNVPPDEPKVFVIGPNQAQAMLHEARSTNSLYVGKTEALADLGYVKNFLGFTFVISNLLTVPASGQLTCFAMTRRAMGLSVAKEPWLRVAEDPSASFAWRIYMALTMGATRVEDERLVQVQVKDTFTAA